MHVLTLGLCHCVRVFSKLALQCTQLAPKFHSFSLPPSLIPLSLSSHRLHAWLKLLFAFSRNIIFFPLPTLQPSPSPVYPIQSYNPMNLISLRCHTSTFSRSFFPSTILLWNSLPSSLSKTLSPLFSPIACPIIYDPNSPVSNKLHLLIFTHSSLILSFLIMYNFFTLQISQLTIECYHFK